MIIKIYHAMTCTGTVNEEEMTHTRNSDNEEIEKVVSNEIFFTLGNAAFYFVLWYKGL